MIFKFLHIAFMFAAVTAALGPEPLLGAIARSRDVAAIRTGFTIANRLSRAIGPLFTVGLLFGLLTAWNEGFNFFAPWLLIAYALFITSTLVGVAVVAPHVTRVAQLAANSPADAPSPELAGALASRRGELLSVFVAVLILAFVFDMVVKPFS
jgi:uncharacterized membrane protein